MNWRTGHLELWPPRSYAAKGGRQLTLQLPLVMFNTGPTPIVLRNLRVVIAGEPQPVIGSFQATVSKLATDDGREWASALPIRGREAVSIVAQFSNRNPGLTFVSRTYTVEVQARLNKSEKWTSLITFDLRVTDQHLPQLNELFIAHDNELEL